MKKATFLPKLYNMLSLVFQFCKSVLKDGSKNPFLIQKSLWTDANI